MKDKNSMKMNGRNQLGVVAILAGALLSGCGSTLRDSKPETPADTLRAAILKDRSAPLTNLDVQAHLNVRDFGAVPNDGKDDRAAVQAAIGKAKSMGDPVQIDFDPGTYDFSAASPSLSDGKTEAAIALPNCGNLIIDGHGAEIMIHRQDVSFIRVQTSTNVIIRNFMIDYDPLPFSQGTVQSVNSADGSFVFELQAGFPPPDDPFFKSCNSWGMLKDQEHPGRLKVNAPAALFYDSILPLDGTRFRIVLKNKKEITNVAAEDAFVINGRSASIGWYSSSDNITFDHLTIHACPSALFLGLQTSRLNILNCKAELKDNRLITAGADGVHCQAARIGPWVENCDFEGLSDDCLNIYGLPIYVLEQVSPTQLTVHVRAPILSGDRLAFFNPNEGRIILETTVASFSGSTLVLNDPLDEPLNIAPSGTPLDGHGWKSYDHAYNLDAVGSRFVYRNNTMHDGRRYGVFIKASDGLIENNVFEGLSSTGLAILNTPSWPEGFWAQNLVIQSNRVSECGYAGSVPPAIIASKKLLSPQGEATMTTPMQKTIFLLNNEFNAIAGPALLLQGVSDLVLEGNVFTSGSTSGPLVTVQHSTNITWSGSADQRRVQFQ